MKEEKICENPECKETFTSINLKQKYCTLKCKNRHNYLIRLEKFPQLYQLNKIYLKNFNIIHQQYMNGVKSLSEHDLKLLGFDYNVKPIVKKTDNGLTAFVFEGYFLYYKEGQVLIVKYK